MYLQTPEAAGPHQSIRVSFAYRPAAHGVHKLSLGPGARLSAQALDGAASGLREKATGEEILETTPELSHLSHHRLYCSIEVPPDKTFRALFENFL